MRRIGSEGFGGDTFDGFAGVCANVHEGVGEKLVLGVAAQDFGPVAHVM